MKKNILISLIVSLILLPSCVKTIDTFGFSKTTQITGRVIEKSEYVPIEGVNVYVSDGTHTQASSITDYNGRFIMEVDFDNLNDTYKLHLDCPNYPHVIEELKGMGQEKYDYKDVILYDKNDPTNWPQITTSEVSNIDGVSAMCGGLIKYSGPASITMRGVCWSTNHEPTIENTHTSNGSGTGSFISNINNLNSNTNYYVRAYAINQHGTYYGNLIQFSTTNGLPVVSTTEPTLSGSTITTGGNVTKDNGVTITNRGVCYSMSPNPTINGNHTDNGSGLGVYTSTFTATQSGTYYIRAYATNVNGTSYGEQLTIIYMDLPTFQYGGHTYWVAPDPGNKMSRATAASYCANFGIYGTIGWKLPEVGELTQMYAERMNIGGFEPETYWSNTFGSSGGIYANRYYYVNFSTGAVHYTDETTFYRVRPIKQID